jgi:hypothetical protein
LKTLTLLLREVICLSLDAFWYRPITEDGADYLHDPIPTSWINVIDGLNRIAKDEPLIKMHSDDHDTQSVVRIM